MATIINTPGQPDTGNSATIWVVGLIIIVLIGLFAFFVWPGLANQAAAPANTTIVEPTPQQPANNNVYNTTINATSTVNNSTSTNP